MRTATAKEFTSSVSSFLDAVRKGNEVIITVKGKAVAILKPLAQDEEKLNPVGFGMWKDRTDLASVADWVENRRAERFPR